MTSQPQINNTTTCERKKIPYHYHSDQTLLCRACAATAASRIAVIECEDPLLTCAYNENKEAMMSNRLVQPQFSARLSPPRRLPQANCTRGASTEQPRSQGHETFLEFALCCESFGRAQTSKVGPGLLDESQISFRGLQIFFH